MIDIVSVRFKSGGKHYYFDPNGIEVKSGEDVIVETSRGAEYGECVYGNHPINEDAVVQPLRPVIRVATEEDKKTVEKNKEKEEKAFQICQEKILAHGLEMKLVDAEYSFEGNKVLFFFTAEGRVDFRALVKDLASTIHARIELRQIGVRDEAKMLGGLGICGRPFCCSQFLDEFQPVSIKMAKTQNLSLNPTKISGTCGRLMCCLKYEQDAYEDLVKRTPKAESFVETPDGAGTVSSVNLLRQQVNVRLESDPETPHCYHNCEICVIRNGKGKRPEGYVEPPLEELAKLRRPVEEEEQPKAQPAQENHLAAALGAVLSLGEEQSRPQATQEEGEERRARPHRNRNRTRKPREEGAAPKTPAQEGQAVKVEKAPKPEKAQHQEKEPRPAQEGEKKRSHSFRPRRPKTGPKAEGGEKAPQNQNAPKAQSPSPAQEGEKKHRPNYNRRRRPRGGGNGGSRPAGGGQEG